MPSVAACPAQVGGTGKAAASSKASVRYLSTAASTARGGLRTGTPAAATRCKASIRKTTCSRLPGGIIRTRTPSAAVRSSSPALTRAAGRLGSRRPPRRAETGRHCNDTPSRPAARCRSSTCQPKPETRATSDVIDAKFKCRSRFESSTVRLQLANERASTSAIDSPEGMGIAGLDVLKHNLGGAEQVRIDGVKVVVVTGEDRRERLAVIARGRRGNLRADRFEARRRRR